MVSTIDFLIASGEPHRKHHHILAAMRMMHSDLILDEIDGYEPKALLAVLRLVTASAMFGRNVIASSATLSKPLAKMLWQAYQHGAEMRGLLHKESPVFKTAIIDDLIKPSVTSHENVDTFMAKYVSHVEDMMLKLEGKDHRKPVLAAINVKDDRGWLSTICTWANILHKHQAWVDEVTGKRLTFGLVRIANVTTAVKVAKHLAETIPGSKVACYHSNHFPMQRFHIEKTLDYLLTRKDKNPNTHIVANEEIRKILDTAAGDVQFIVVATPVEEIGRDHDFDWAIIEPSSAQSIVQTAGRVNRHRLAIVTSPNIALLQYCYREIKNEKTVFTKPGLESINGSKSTHESHDLSDLFEWDTLNQIDARMRFCSDIHSFAKFDDKAIEGEVNEIFNSMLTCNPLWMAKETYTESSLRSLEPSVELRLDDPDSAKNYKVRSQRDNDGEEECAEICRLIPTVANDWLVKEDSTLIADAQELNVDVKKAMTVSISCFLEKNKKPSLFVHEKICRHKSFGFYIES